ncbi:hypothetical protein DFH08DRAFT_976871 [Mycena albidolilacea]|uniref:Uncharacterized protein n=1 Tax=Mycena albidolilacea TaxID=1033008 RepID=A0AAD6Z1M1_9AGAR|nr:hypothetical protein DFH08DRAFT_976871 [Mycena albidolilacea]
MSTLKHAGSEFISSYILSHKVDLPDCLYLCSRRPYRGQRSTLVCARPSHRGTVHDANPPTDSFANATHQLLSPLADYHPTRSLLRPTEPAADVVALLVKVMGGWTATVATDHASAQRGAHIVLGGILVQFGTHAVMQFSVPVSGFIVGHTVVAITYWCLASDFFIRYAFDRPVKVRMSDPTVVGQRFIYNLKY